MTESPLSTESRSSVEAEGKPADAELTQDDSTAGGGLFRKFAHRTSCAVGTPFSFLLACVTVLAWGISGPLFQFSDTWQLVINTGTTIVTFLMVFLIQNTQNRDALAIQLKLDELIRAVAGARNQLVDLEDLPDSELARIKAEFARIREGMILDRISSTPLAVDADKIKQVRDE